MGMDKTEAIKRIKDHIRVHHIGQYPHIKIAEAMSMAISALETDNNVGGKVEVPCYCCDCYYLLNSKNSFGLYFYCGHENGLKNLKNTQKNFCPWGKTRYENG